MLQVTYDLHIHSCLSPCGDEEMTPANIAGMAAVKELQVIAVTDHNSCKNCPAVIKTAAEYGVLALPGMELTTEEEVHVLCLFAKLSDAFAFDAFVYENLLPVPNDERIFGRQLVMDEQERIIEKPEKLLINATSISFDAVYGLMEEYHGVMIPAHLDKTTTSLLSNLGFIPPDSRFAVAEFARLSNLHRLRKEHPYLDTCNVICNSDAHYLQDIHEPEFTLVVEEVSAEGVLDALVRMKRMSIGLSHPFRESAKGLLVTGRNNPYKQT